jgi:LysR family transcriptional regulator, transcription activator of glutamate synthase operon
MEFLQLKYFQIVARHEHMTRAANELSIAQPSLSQTISRLEHEIGVPLFDRKGKQIRLNQYGSVFLQYVDQAFSVLNAGQQEVANLAGLEQGYISLAVTSSALLGDLLGSFRVSHPNVRFRVQQRSPEDMLLHLESGEIDLYISTLPIEKQGIKQIILMTDEIFLIVPAGHHLAGRKSIHLNEVAREPFINLRSGNTFRDLTDSLCLQAGFKPDIAIEIDEQVSKIRLVGSGLGISFLSSFSMRYIGDSTVVPVRIEEPKFQRVISLAWKEDRYQSLAAREFRQFIIEYFAKLT